jgi:hypothetical protein
MCGLTGACGRPSRPLLHSPKRVSQRRVGRGRQPRERIDCGARHASNPKRSEPPIAAARWNERCPTTRCWWSKIPPRLISPRTARFTALAPSQGQIFPTCMGCICIRVCVSVLMACRWVSLTNICGHAIVLAGGKATGPRSAPRVTKKVNAGSREQQRHSTRFQRQAVS